MTIGERDLPRLLDGLSPRLCSARYAFDQGDDTWQSDAFALIREDEGVTAIRESAVGKWARITLEVHSSLEAVGLTAAFSKCLADAGISANVIAALYHDHIFVPWERRADALAAMQALSSDT